MCPVNVKTRTGKFPFVNVGADPHIIDCISGGGILLYPTATVYGLGGDATHPTLPDRIRHLKGSPPGKPLLALTDEWDRVLHWITEVGPLHRKLMAYQPALPITLLFKATPRAPSALCGDSPFIGIRRTMFPVCRTLIKSSDRPLCSTSANIAGSPPPGRFEDIHPSILSQVACMIDARQPLGGQPSTLIQINHDQISVLREGAVSTRQIQIILNEE